VMVTMLRGAMAGVPLFSSPKMFINALGNKGPFGEIFKGVGMDPVPFLSEDQATKMVSVESKLFSIYATGVVKAGKRETRVRIHAVVDFRNAPPPGAATVLNAAAALAGQGQAAPSAGQPTPAAGAPDLASALASVLRPNPGGTIIHYKVE